MVFVSELVSALILAVVQGLTEWVPVSSSGHLILFERLLGFSGGLTFNVALHFGTLMAVFVYFGKDITDIIQDLLRGKWKSEHGRMGLLLIIASIPAAIIGFLVKDFFESVLSGLGVVALGFGITGLFLLIASFHFNGKKIGGMKKLGYGNAFLIGIAQALSIVPGISRSGATISSGVLLGLNEKNAMRFAFLMSIPVIFGANIIFIGNQTLPKELIWATLVSFIVGLASIHVIFKYVLIFKKNFRWFGIYCLLLALAIGIWLLV
ncbi:MAG: undecaprenyl-diphosphate phosphatase [Nanoarchaeota archaeon]|nr:undecaprenyl-diphosphate phosphatase [Nanoarchaeota archaeon]